MIRIRRAVPTDLTEVLDLLRRADLPTDGVEEHFGSFLVAEREGAVVAAAGLEREDENALLRSVAVSPDVRGEGLGTEIVRQTLRFAAASRVESVYLLTTSAARFFARLGFTPALRAEVDANFPESTETGSAGCCASAEPMVLRDLSRVTEPRPRR